MSYIIKVTVFIFSLVMLTEEGISGHVLGDKYKADKHSTLVLYHYKKDVNKPWLTGDFDFPGIICIFVDENSIISGGVFSSGSSS